MNTIMSLRLGRLAKINKSLSALTAILGGLLIAINIPESRYGFFLFLHYSLTWAYIAHRIKDVELLIIEIAFVTINLLGVYRWILT